MATYNKFQDFVEQVCKAIHDLDGTHTLKVALTNTAPSATQTTWNVTDHPAPAAANGYTAGGTATTPTLTESSGTAKLVLSDVVFTASGGNLGPFRYVVIYNDTAASDNAIAWYDYGSSITLADGETFTIDFDASAGFFTLA